VAGISDDEFFGGSKVADPPVVKGQAALVVQDTVSIHR